MFLRFGFLALFLGTANAQELSVGIAGGGSLTNAFESVVVSTPPTGLTSFSQSKDWLLGPTLEYRFGHNVSLEVDGLYRELHLTFAGIEPDGSLNSVSPSPVVTWEFPILGKYRFHLSKVDPFVEAGPEFRTTGNLNANPSHRGVAAGLGVEMHWKNFDIAPVIRYTRWARDSASEAGSKSDQVELMLELSRRSRFVSHPLGTHFSVGLVGGMTLLHDFSDMANQGSQLTVIPGGAGGYTFQQISGTYYQSGNYSLLVGPAIEGDISKRLSVEVDAIYHPLRATIGFILSGQNSGRFSTYTQAITWEFPVLAKYKFDYRGLKPFVEAGPSFRLPQEVGGHLATYGATAGAGVEVHWHWLKIAPALRFTRWGSDSPAGSSGVRRNQFEFLTGFSL